MKRIILIPVFLTLAVLSACSLSTVRLPAVDEIKTDAGHTVFYVATDADFVSINVAFPNNYLFTEGANPAAPHLGLRLIQQAGAGKIEPAALIEEFEKLDADANLFAQTHFFAWRDKC